MSRITRKELKSDKFAAEVEHTVEYVAEHRRQIVRYATTAGAVLLIAAGIYWFLSHRTAERQGALAKALKTQEAPIGDAAPGVLSFRSEIDRRVASRKEFNEIIKKYPGSTEWIIAHYFLGAIAADEGNLQEAEKGFKVAADSGDKKYSALAKVSLAQIYFANGRVAEGEKLLRWLIDNPTVFISKEQATFALAEGLAKTKPEEARKLLEPLRGSKRNAVSQAAISAMGELGSR